MIQSAANLGFPTPEDMENGYNTYLGAHTRSVLLPPPKLLG
jgi:DsbC/DsbD-like thiol-disulfide interchange protein